MKGKFKVCMFCHMAVKDFTLILSKVFKDTMCPKPIGSIANKLNNIHKDSRFKQFTRGNSSKIQDGIGAPSIFFC